MNTKKITVKLPIDVLTSASHISSNTLNGDPKAIIMECVKYTVNNASFIDKQSGSCTRECEDLLQDLDFDSI